MPKYCKTCKKKGHNEPDYWVIHPELHKRFDEVAENGNTGKEVIGTAANPTKVLTSGKVLGKPIPNPARQEWMQKRKIRYQRDKNSHIIDNGKEKEDGKFKEKIIEDVVETKRKLML